MYRARIFSDIHIGGKVFSPKHREDIAQVLDRTVQDLESGKLDEVHLSGDIFDDWGYIRTPNDSKQMHRFLEHCLDIEPDITPLAERLLRNRKVRKQKGNHETYIAPYFNMVPLSIISEPGLCVLHGHQFCYLGRMPRIGRFTYTLIDLLSVRTNVIDLMINAGHYLADKLMNDNYETEFLFFSKQAEKIIRRSKGKIRTVISGHTHRRGTKRFYNREGQQIGAYHNIGSLCEGDEVLEIRGSQVFHNCLKDYL